MPDEIKKVDNPDSVRQTKETVDVIPLTQEGGTVDKLSDIFSRVEQGENVGDAIKEVNTPDKKEVVEQEKKVAAEPEKKEPSDLEQKLADRQRERHDTEEVSRESLKKQGQPKETDDKKDAVTTDDDVPAEELQVLPHDKPKTAKRIQALLKKIDAVSQAEALSKKQIEERDSKLKELTTQLETVKSVDPRTNEEIKKQLDELAMFRRKYELENDPEVKTKFDARAESSENSIKDILRKKGAGDGLMKIIEDEGGWIKFSESSRVITLSDQSKTTAAELADSVLQSLPLSDRKAVEAAMVDVFNTRRDKQRFFEEQQKSANDYFKKKDDERVKQSEEQKKQVEESAKQIDAWIKDVTAKEEFLKEKEIPAGATPEQRAAIEEDNKTNRQLNSILKKSLKAEKLPELLEIVLDSVRYYDERRRTDKLTKENAKLRADLKAKADEIDKVRNAGRSVPRGTSIAGGGSAGSPSAPRRAEGLEAAFSAIASGHKLDGSGNILTQNDE